MALLLYSLRESRGELLLERVEELSDMAPVNERVMYLNGDGHAPSLILAFDLAPGNTGDAVVGTIGRVG